MIDRLPPLPLPTPSQAYSSGTASPRVSSIASSSSSNADSQSSYTSVASSNGPKTPPSHSLPGTNLNNTPASSLQTPLVQPNIAGYEQYQAMNQGPADMYYPQQHMPSQAPPQPVTSGALAQYNPHQQPPLLQPGSAQYPNPASYGQYGYANGLTSPPTGGPAVSNPMAANPHVLPLPGGAQQGMANQYTGFDTTGQIAPPGMKPRVTATLWEDEGSLCFQVEARGICVARREDNHMINGTKLLNVAGMTRGRRDGILKSEKTRHVVKIGPMHLKGVWIPFERALDFANKEKITELLFPLFVHNIAGLLYHPTNHSRTNQVMAAAERRKQEQSQMRNGQPTASTLPSLHHHSTMALPGPPQTLPSSHTNLATPTGRPPLERSQTFPTPPTSASSVMAGGMSASEPFQWPQQGVNGGQPANPMSVDTSLSNARSMPATPATTPPGPPLQAMQPYPPTSQSYDSRPIYHQSSAPAPQHPQQQPQHPQHQQHQQHPSQQPHPYSTAPPSSAPQDRGIYGQNAAAAAAAAAAGYVKQEMPSAHTSRPSVASLSGNEQVDQKPNGLLSHHAGSEQVSQQVPEDETEHEAEYTHDSGAYDASRAQYNYATSQVSTMPNDHSHIATDVNSTANHQGTSGRSTPRSAAAPQAYYQQGYNTPPRSVAAAAVTQASSNLYSVMTNDRTTANGPQADVYAPPADMNTSMQNGYATPILNGSSPGLKRGRDDDDDRSSMDMKRRKTLMDSSMPSSVYDPSAMNRAAPAIATPRRR